MSPSLGIFVEALQLVISRPPAPALVARAATAYNLRCSHVHPAMFHIVRCLSWFAWVLLSCILKPATFHCRFYCIFFEVRFHFIPCLQAQICFFICCHIFANSLPWVLASHRLQTWNLQYNLPSHTCWACLFRLLAASGHQKLLWTAKRSTFQPASIKFVGTKTIQNQHKHIIGWVIVIAGIRHFLDSKSYEQLYLLPHVIVIILRFSSQPDFKKSWSEKSWTKQPRCFLAFCPFWWHGSHETIWMCSIRCIYLFWQTHFPCYFYLVQKKRELVPWQTYQTIFLQNLDPQNLHVYRLNSDSQNLLLLVNGNAPDWS
jgi:hypothetical protein